MSTCPQKESHMQIKMEIRSKKKNVVVRQDTCSIPSFRSHKRGKLMHRGFLRKSAVHMQFPSWQHVYSIAKHWEKVKPQLSKLCGAVDDDGVQGSRQAWQTLWHRVTLTPPKPWAFLSRTVNVWRTTDAKGKKDKPATIALLFHIVQRWPGNHQAAKLIQMCSRCGNKRSTVLHTTSYD